jgi:hypothetical protein
VRVRARVRLKGFFLVPKSHQHARAQVSLCLSFIDPSLRRIVLQRIVHATNCPCDELSATNCPSTDFTVNSFDENDQKNNLATTMRFDLIKELIKLLMLCICFLRQPKKIKIP